MFFTCNGLFHFVAFINGGIYGFDGFWQEAEPGIRRTVRKNLRRKQVVDFRGRVDDNAISEVVDMVLTKLLTAARRQGPAVFSPGRAYDCPAGLSKWMQTLVGNCVKDYCKRFHGDRSDLKNVSLDGLELNPVSPSSADGDEVIDGVFRLEHIKLVRDCLAELEQNDRFLLMQVYFEDKSHRELAADLGLNPTTAFRMIDDARSNFLRLLIARRRPGGGQRPSPVNHGLAG